MDKNKSGTSIVFFIESIIAIIITSSLFGFLPPRRCRNILLIPTLIFKQIFCSVILLTSILRLHKIVHDFRLLLNSLLLIDLHLII